MNVRKIVESYEQGRSATATRPSPRTSAHRTRPRPRPRTTGSEPSPVTASQRPPRTQRPPNLKIVKEERPVAMVLKERINELQVEQRSNPPRVSVPLTSDANHNCGHPSITSAELLCTLAPPLFRPSGPSPALSPSPSVSSSKLALQQRVTLRARRQQRYSRDESALTTALRRTADYERIFPPRPSIQYATKQLELRVRDAKACLADLRELLRDDTTDRETHQAALRARWMLERWIKSAENELTRANTTTGCPVTPDPVGPSTQNTRRDANLAYFFAHSPTRTTASPKTKHRYPSPIEQPRRISKQNVEPPQLRMWPLASTLHAPMKLKALPSTSKLFVPDSRSVVPVPPHNLSSSPEPQHAHDVDLISPLAEPSPPQQGIHTSTFPALPDTPLEDSRTRTWHGFAVIYVPSQPSDEELLAVLGADMATEPMPEYVSYLLNQLEPIGEDVVLPGLSRRESTTTSGFELISRPSIEAYDYPVLPRSRLLVRRSMQVMRVTPQGRPRLGVMSGLRVACESHSPPPSPSRPAGQGLAFPRSGVFSKMRRSMAVRGH
ncbi:hypothetical protein V8E52_011380 [Russula decolorans]